MKLPRISDPTTHRCGNVEVTIASHFDLMPTWAQWTLVLVTVTPAISLLVCMYLQHKGILK